MTADTTEIQDDHRFPCTTCGADLRYKPGSSDLSCHHCGAHSPIESGSYDSFHEKSFDEALERADKTRSGAAPHPTDGQSEESIRVTGCPNCGAQVSFEGARHASECPYCATPVVVSTGAHRQLKPQAVLPFAIAEDAAQKAMADWLGSLWFAPNALKKYARKGRRLNGIYMPFWTYDARTETDYSGQRGDDYYVTVGSGENKRRERRTRWRRKRGHVQRLFDDILIVASHALPRKYVDDLAPWHFHSLEPYLPDYLAGFRSEAYNVSLEDGFEEAQDVMERVVRRDIRFDIGGDRQRITSMNMVCHDVTFKHILLPVWTAAYKFRGKTYRFVINGQTGKVQGERPYSWFKITCAVILALAVAAGLGYAYAWAEANGALPK